MELHNWQDWLTLGLRPHPVTVIITFLIALALPLLLHTYLYRSAQSTQLPAFLLVGPSGSGKTSLLTLFERGSAAQTHTSQAPLTVQCSLPVETRAASDRYRSVNDPTNKVHKNFLLVDTPGHGKLRHFALNSVLKPQNLKGIIYVADAAALSGDGGDADGGLTEAAQYLHDLLMLLQTAHTKAKTSKGPAEMPVLVAANKLDLFTALPAKLVKAALEAEITKLRTSKTRGLLDSGVGMDDMVEESEVLGGNGEGKFEFKLMEEYNIPIEVVGGNVQGADGAETSKWWDWMARHL